MGRSFKKVFAVLCLLATCAPSVARGEAVLTLDQCYQMALTQSETVAIQEETIRIAEAHYLQALGTVLPHINIVSTELLQQTGNAQNSGGLGSTVARMSQPQVAVNYSETLFQGLREFRALAMARAEKSKNALTWMRAKQLLYSDVANAYFTVLEMERQVSISEAMRTALSQRMRELSERIALGKSRDSELLAVESQKAAVEGDLELFHGLINTSRDLLGFLVGREVRDRLADPFQVPKDVGHLEQYQQNVSSRPDLSAAEEAVRQADSNVSYEKGLRWPTLGVSANYYPYRVGFYSDIKVDALFNLSVPLFEGGATKGLIREAEALYRQQRLQKQETFRQADSDVRQAYDQLIASRRREDAFRLAESKAAASYRAQAEEYRLGIVSNLDVLQSLRDWQLTRLSENLAHFQSKMNYVLLKVTEGDLRLPETDADAASAGVTP